MATPTAKVHDISRKQGTEAETPMQGTWDGRSWYSLLLPHGRYIRMTQEAKGVFIPYPLLGILLTLAVVMISGIIALEVQVSNLNTTILLRDADSRAEIMSIKEKSAQLEVYIHNDREKLVRIETQLDNPKRR